MQMWTAIFLECVLKSSVHCANEVEKTKSLACVMSQQLADAQFFSFFHIGAHNRMCCYYLLVVISILLYDSFRFAIILCQKPKSSCSNISSSSPITCNKQQQIMPVFRFSYAILFALTLQYSVRIDSKCHEVYDVFWCIMPAAYSNHVVYNLTVQPNVCTPHVNIFRLWKFCYNKCIQANGRHYTYLLLHDC